MGTYQKYLFIHTCLKLQKVIEILPNVQQLVAICFIYWCSTCVIQSVYHSLFTLINR